MKLAFSPFKFVQCLKRRRPQQLSEAKRVARLTRCKQLLKSYDDSAVDFTWFTDKKVFTAVRSALRQEDIHSTQLRTRSTFSKSVMVSVAVSKMGMTELMFVDP